MCLYTLECLDLVQLRLFISTSWKSLKQTLFGRLYCKYTLLFFIILNLKCSRFCNMVCISLWAFRTMTAWFLERTERLLCQRRLFPSFFFVDVFVLADAIKMSSQSLSVFKHLCRFFGGGGPLYLWAGFQGCREPVVLLLGNRRNWPAD